MSDTLLFQYQTDIPENVNHFIIKIHYLYKGKKYDKEFLAGYFNSTTIEALQHFSRWFRLNFSRDVELLSVRCKELPKNRQFMSEIYVIQTRWGEI